jgi:hypothetical protein
LKLGLSLPKDEHRLRVFQNKVLRITIFGAETEELNSAIAGPKPG